MLVRPKSPRDVDALRRADAEAFRDHPFSPQTEHLLVESLRAAGALDVSLVAGLEGSVVGHISFSRAGIGGDTPDRHPLEPVAVLPGFQRQGIGRALVEAGVAALRARGAARCVPTGDPAFSTRFGFAALPGVNWVGVPGENVLCLHVAGPVPHGQVACHQAFSIAPE